ncbi:uncharacterized protein LOC133367348 [Rhineura floridana]|uniref:uncharacterized protein LOC133367348 n=1 Tax=Rhineura floridana TaxID=261503 RepID=UPI002AC8767A|nr:uncharacterized protein LOC133367348 [Rhineura floridana]
MVPTAPLANTLHFSGAPHPDNATSAKDPHLCSRNASHPKTSNFSPSWNCSLLDVPPPKSGHPIFPGRIEPSPDQSGPISPLDVQANRLQDFPFISFPGRALALRPPRREKEMGNEKSLPRAAAAHLDFLQAGQLQFVDEGVGGGSNLVLLRPPPARAPLHGRVPLPGSPSSSLGLVPAAGARGLGGERRMDGWVGESAGGPAGGWRDALAPDRSRREPGCSRQGGGRRDHGAVVTATLQLGDGLSLWRDRMEEEEDRGFREGEEASIDPLLLMGIQPSEGYQDSARGQPVQWGSIVSPTAMKDVRAWPSEESRAGLGEIPSPGFPPHLFLFDPLQIYLWLARFSAKAKSSLQGHLQPGTEMLQG